MTDPMTHPSDEDLTLLFFGDGSVDEQARLRDHLAACARCRETLHEVTMTLQLASTHEVAEPDADLEARLWAGIAPHLPRASAWSRHRRTWIGLAAAAALLVVGGASGWLALQRGAETPATVAETQDAPDAQFRERVLLTAVDAHLTQTEMVFVELMNAPTDGSDSLAYARQTADDLVTSGRLYRETARDTGATQLVSVLDELETVLVEVARSTDRPRAQDIDALRGRIEQEDLLFKVRAVAADIADRQGRTMSGGGTL
jgi:anti-sigma factor RsiW